MEKDVIEQNNRMKVLEDKVMQLEKENRDVKNLFDSLFNGSNETRIYFKRQIIFDKQSIIGFFGKDPVKQQTLASDTLANLLTALRNLGLIS